MSWMLGLELYKSLLSCSRFVDNILKWYNTICMKFYCCRYLNTQKNHLKGKKKGHKIIVVKPYISNIFRYFIRGAFWEIP